MSLLFWLQWGLLGWIPLIVLGMLLEARERPPLIVRRWIVLDTPEGPRVIRLGGAR